MACWNALFDQARVAFAQQRSAERARALGLSALTCLGRHTSSGLLCYRRATVPRLVSGLSAV